MATLDELIEQQPPAVQSAIEAICDKAGTSDADWEVLLAAGEMVAVLQAEQRASGSLIERVVSTLDGIDKTEIEAASGWWETSTGADFGARKLAAVIRALCRPASRAYRRELR